MKTLRINLCLLLVLATQIYAQRFTAGAMDSILTGSINPNESYGYFPDGKQIALLGEKNSSYANLMLAGGPDTTISGVNITSYNVVNSYGTVFGTIKPITVSNIIQTSIYDNSIGAVLVLDSLNDDKKNAIVLFSSLTNLFIVQIAVTNTNKISYNVVKKITLPESMWAAGENNQGEDRRLALLGVSQSSSDKVYHIAIGNPNSKNGTNEKVGRIDFFSLIENTWTFSQPNILGLTSGINGIFLGEASKFGTDLIPIMYKDGKNALAVLLPKSSQYPQSAIYIFSMDTEWIPNAKPPIILTGNSMPWVEDPEVSHDCSGLSIANWEKPHILVSCNILKQSDMSIIVKDIVLDSNFAISSSSTFLYRNISGLNRNQSIKVNPLSIKNHKNYSNSISIVTNVVGTRMRIGTILIFPVMDADYSKNYSIEADKPEILVNLDSLFYKSGTSGFSAKTLSGLVKCETQNNNLLCAGEENAIGSWSALEISSKNGCDPYRECKRKDTLFVYVRSQKENPNIALRIPKDIVIPFFERKNFNDLEALSYFRNPDQQSTKISWDASNLKLSVATSSKPNELSIIALSQKEGIDTITFNLSANKYPTRIHIADSSKILNKAYDSDTIWNTAQKRYIALPLSNSNGNIYTYDIAQNGLEKYAEIAGDYLHILKVEVADISIAYTEDSKIKYRKITLMPENFNPPDKITIGLQTQNLRVMRISGGLQINGLNGEFEIKAYDFKGKEIQRKRAYAQGSTFVKLEQNCPKIVQIKSGNQKVYVKIAN